MRELAIVLGLIKQHDIYLLQLRNGDPKIGAANLIGCFGGKIEAGESAVSAVCRELAEETTLKISEKDAQYLGKIEVISDHQLEEVKILAEVFLITTHQEVVEAKEGHLMRLGIAEARQRLGDMSPGTQAVFETYVLNGE